MIWRIDARRIVSAFSIVLLFGLSSGCTAPGEESSIPEVAPDGKEEFITAQFDDIDFDAMDQTITDLESYLQGLSNLPSIDECSKKAVEYLQGNATIQSVDMEQEGGIGRGTLTVQFKNGMIYVIIIGKELSKQPEVHLRAAVHHSADPLGSMGQGLYPDDDSEESEAPMQTSGEMAFVDLDGGLGVNAKYVYDLMKNYEFDPSKMVYGGPGDARIGKVAFFKTLHKYKLLLIVGHGNYCERLNSFVLLTTESTSKEKDRAFFQSRDFQTGRLVYGKYWALTDSGLKPIQAKSYLVTARFLDAYLGQFQKDSVVFFNTCKSAYGYGFGTHLRDSLPSRQLPGTSLPATLANKGVHTLFGWTWYVDNQKAYDAEEYFFDRVMGNDVFWRDGFPTPTPNNTPHTFSAVASKARDLKYFWDPANQASYELIDLHWDARDYFIRPSIQVLGVSPQQTEKQLNVSGLIGLSGGQLCLNKSCQAIGYGDDWKDGEIKAQLPSEFAGPIEIRANGILSNTVTLNEWRGNVDFEVAIKDGCKLSGKLSYRFRGDYRRKRSDPDGQTHPPLLAATLDRDSKVTYAIAGKWEDQYNKYECEGAGSLDVTTEARFGTAILNPTAPGMSMVGTQPMMYKATFKTTSKLDGSVKVETYSDLRAVVAPFTTNEAGEIPAGSSDLGGMKIEWPEAKPKYPIDPHTPG